LIISISSQKGGVGKTTTAISLAGAMSEMGKKILVIDADPQGNLGIGFNLNVYELAPTMYEVMVEDLAIQEVIHQVRNNLDIAPANLQLSGAEPQLMGSYRREDRLKNALRPVRDQYDYIFIDCPPSLGLLTINSLTAADAVLIPVSTDYYSLVGLRLILETTADIQAQVNPQLTVLGLAPTRYDRRTRHAQEVLEEIRKLNQRYRVFDTVIRETVRLKESPVTGQTITEYSGDHPGAEDYRSLAKEVMQINGKETGFSEGQ
jgi:chromosome partitioning protein